MGAKAAWQAALLPGAEECGFTHRGQHYRIQLTLPAGPGPFPLLYLLDGEEFFPACALYQRCWLPCGENTGAKPLAIVGVGFGREHLQGGQLRVERYTAGATALLDFLDTALPALLAEKANLDHRRRAVFGHSLAGRWVLASYFRRPSFARLYLAASPSIWWDGRSILRDEELMRPDLLVPRRLWLSVGGLEQWDRNPARRLLLKERGQIRELTALQRRLRARGLAVQLRIYPGEGHGTVRHRQIPDLLRQVYQYLG